MELGVQIGEGEREEEEEEKGGKKKKREEGAGHLRGKEDEKSGDGRR
jgi:hypothetical protein